MQMAAKNSKSTLKSLQIEVNKKLIEVKEELKNVKEEMMNLNEKETVENPKANEFSCKSCDLNFCSKKKLKSVKPFPMD